MLFFIGCMNNNNFTRTDNVISDEAIIKKEFAVVTSDTLALDVINNPIFNDFGRFILPTEYGVPDKDMKLSGIDSLLPYHNNLDSNITVNVINYMIDKIEDEEKLFYDYYTDDQKQQDKSKENTGLFYFKGKEGEPFAVICPGGGFSYVGSIHEGFPYALELSQQGYNAFVIQYRVGSADVACEDLSAAISYIFENYLELGVNIEDYSVWGSSAGARMVAYIGSYGTKRFGGDDLPKPSSVIMAYTGHSDYTENEPSTFAVVGERDGIANQNVMQRRIDNLNNYGVDTEFHKYPNLGHGFGLGSGTTAEGWINHAIKFWERHMGD